jgi:limonene-1,2-epoxide hydrolase
MPDSPLDTALAFVQAINRADLAALRALMTEDHTFTDALGNRTSGAEKMIVGWQYFFDAIPAYWIRTDAAFADGLQVALFGEAGGKWRVDGRILTPTWSVRAAWLAQMESGKVKAWSVYCDTAWGKPAEAPAQDKM